MLKGISLGVFLFALGLLGIFAWKGEWVAATPATMNHRLHPDERSAQFRTLELEALSGSVDAANALMNYHSKCHQREGLSPDLTPERFNDCANKVGYWTTIALENGSIPAAQRQTNFLIESKKCRDIHRAEFWFHKFRGHFKSDPVFLKSVRDEIEEKKQSCTW